VSLGHSLLRITACIEAFSNASAVSDKDIIAHILANHPSEHSELKISNEQGLDTTITRITTSIIGLTVSTSKFNAADRVLIEFNILYNSFTFVSTRKVK
jgi:hypothetical protein